MCAEIDPQQCQNCKRRQCNSAQEPYRLQFHTVHSSRIRKQGVFKHVSAYTGNRARDYTLCQECFEYLVEQKDPDKCAWPAASICMEIALWISQEHIWRRAPFLPTVRRRGSLELHPVYDATVVDRCSGGGHSRLERPGTSLSYLHCRPSSCMFPR